MAKPRIQKNKEENRRKDPSTRLYAPTREKRRAYDPETGERISEARITAVPISMRQSSELSIFARLGIMLCMFIFAGMLVFILSGYERISRAYSAVNDLNDQIEEIELTIDALEAEIEKAVTIEAAQQYAVSHGMQYAQESQLLQEGSFIPSTIANGPAGSAPTDDEDAEPTPTP